MNAYGFDPSRPSVHMKFAALLLVCSSATSVFGQSLPPLPELKFAPIGAAEKHLGDRWSYMESGRPSAPPVVLLHGVGANSLHWRFQYAGLSERFHVLGWNAPGYVLSDGFKAETPTCQDWADALADFLDALGLRVVNVVGNSFGSLVAQCFAIHHGDRLRRAVLTGTIVGWTDMPEAQRSRVLAEREAQIGKGGYDFGARAEALVGSSTSPELLEVVRNVTRATNPRAFMQVIRFGIGNGFNPQTVAPKMTMPVLLIHGTEDRVAPLARMQTLRDALPNARERLLDGIGHLPEVEAAEQVNGLIIDFLTE